MGSSPTASADRRHNTRPWCNGSTTGSNPVGQGSSPWERALGEPSPLVLAHGPTGRRQLRKLEIRVRLPVSPLHTTTVPWSNGKDAWPTPKRRWFNSIRDYLGPDTPTGRAARLKPGRLRVRLPLWVLTNNWLGRQPADHPGLEPGMLWVRLPPEPLRTIMNNQWPRGAAWSARLPVTQEITGSNPVEGADTARYANRQSGEAQTFVTLWVQLPPVLLSGLCSSRRPVNPLSQKK